MATSEYGVYHLADNPSRYQPVRKNNFRLYVYGLEHLLRVNEDENDDDSYIEDASEVLEFSTINAPSPNFSQNKIEVKRGNSTLKFAGVPSFSSGNLTINDFYSADGKSVLLAWQKLSYDVVNDVIPRADKYKKHAVLLEYLPDNTLIRSWDLYGCWISAISGDDFTSESGDKKTIQATLEYDYAIQTLNKEG